MTYSISRNHSKLPGSLLTTKRVLVHYKEISLGYTFTFVYKVSEKVIA